MKHLIGTTLMLLCASTPAFVVDSACAQAAATEKPAAVQQGQKPAFAQPQIPQKKSGYADLYDVTDDWLPIYDKSNLKGFYMAIGTSGNQFKTAPVAGLCMAELIDHCEKEGQNQDHDIDPIKITTHYKKFQINLGVYSRLRSLNSDSSYSVYG